MKEKPKQYRIHVPSESECCKWNEQGSFLASEIIYLLSFEENGERIINKPGREFVCVLSHVIEEIFRINETRLS